MGIQLSIIKKNTYLKGEKEHTRCVYIKRRFILSEYMYQGIKPGKWTTGDEGLGADAKKFESKAD